MSRALVVVFAATAAPGCQAEEAWEVIEEITVTGGSDSSTGEETVIGSGPGSTTTSGTDGTASTSTQGPGGSVGETDSSSSSGDPTGTVSTGPAPVCGDGQAEGDEECDDGNQNNDDGCLNSCELPYCGDGIVGDDEECDDGNQEDHDGCNSACHEDRIVFVSSELLQGDFGTASGANSKCKALAIAAGLPNGDGYRAWISDGGHSPADKFFKSPGRYVQPDGVVVADNWADLTDGTIQNPIQVDEMGVFHQFAPVWTNTGTNGALHPESADCDGWMTTDFFTKGRFGMAWMTDAEWTDSASEDNPIGCSAMAHFYCFEQ